MSELLLIWGKLGLCAAVIGMAGPELARSGEIIADKTGLSQGWIGLVLLATATSLPELFTGLSAVVAVSAPNIAVGDVLGSCVFNLAILILLDAMHRSPSIYHRAGPGHILTAGFGVILIGLAGVAILLGREGLGLSLAHVGASTPLMALLYFVAMRVVFVFERRQRAEAAGEMADRHPDITLQRALVRYGLAAAFVIGAGVWLPFVAIELADAMGWRTTFVGTLLVAGVTSLPEAVVTVSAARIGAFDMAISNLLGSNLFNILVLVIDDLAFTGGPLLSTVSATHAVSAFSAVIMTGVVIVALLYRSEVRLYRSIGWASLALLLIYVLNSYVIYLYGH